MTKSDWTRTNGGDAGELMTPVESSIQDDRRLLVDSFERSIEAAAESVRRDFVDLLRPYELSVAQYAMLTELKKRDVPARIHELGDVAAAFPSSIVDMIDHLAHRELVTLSSNSVDDQNALIRLSERGRTFIDEIGVSYRNQYVESAANKQNRHFALIIDLFDAFARSSRSA